MPAVYCSLAPAGTFFRCRVPGHGSSHTWTAGMVAPRFRVELAGTPQGSPGGAAYQAAWLGGPWERRVRVRSGLVAVTVPSGSKTMPQPQRCTAIR